MELIPQVLLGIVISCTLFISLISSLGWWKRDDLHGTPNLSFLLNLIAKLAGSFANSVFCTLVFTGIFENLFLLTNFGFRVDLNRECRPGDCEFVAWLLAAFVCKTVHILWILYKQCTVDVFIVDWEHGKSDAARESGCIWRTYFVANVLLRLQVSRQIPPLLLFCVSYLCITLIPGIVGINSGRLVLSFMAVNSSATSATSGLVVALPHLGAYYVFTVSAVTLSVAAAAIYVLGVLRDRFLGNRTREFIDVCSWLNCSIFMRTHRGFAYYVHGKSVHPTAEFGFGGLVEMIRNEEANMVSKRGLHAESDIQTFSFALPGQFDTIYRQMLSQLSSHNNTTPAFELPKDDGTHISFVSRPFSTPFPPSDQTRQHPVLVPKTTTSTNTSNPRGRAQETSLRQRADSHQVIGTFLQRFLEHEFKEADYIVRWRNFLESFFDVETAGVMYYDPKMTFTEYFFVGRTFDLFVFEVLLFCLVAVYTTNYAFALVSVLLVSFVLTQLRAYYGHANLAKKAYVYRRFLL